MVDANREVTVGAGARLRDLLLPTVEGLGYELLGVEFFPAGASSVLRVYIDADEGIDVDDCSKVSRQVSAVMDVEDPIAGQYTLEVSSPGLDRPLFSLEQFQRFIGHPVKMELRAIHEGRRRLRGTIKSVVDDCVAVLDDDGTTYTVAVAIIAKANLVPELG